MGRRPAWTRTEVRDLMWSFGVYGGAVALMLELMSCLSSPPDHAPISSYRSGMSVRVVVRKSGEVWSCTLSKHSATREVRSKLEVFTLHLLRFVGTTTVAAGGDLSDRKMKRGGRWKSDVGRVYTRDNIEDSKRVSRQPVVAREGNQRYPGGGTPRCRDI